MLAPAERTPNVRPSPLPLPSALLAAELGPAVMADDPCEAASSAADPTGPRKYYRARYYDSRTARFMSPDPLGVRATSNLYGYVLGKPTVFIDPRGLYVDLNIFNRKQDAVAWDVAENFMPNLNADGYFTVAGHGNLTGAGNAVRDENLKWLSAKDLARRIKKSPRKCPKVFLFACNAGRLSYAQTLADELGAEVRAPNGWIRFWREYRPWGVSPDPGVNYVTFKPKK